MQTRISIALSHLDVEMDERTRFIIVKGVKEKLLK